MSEDNWHYHFYDTIKGSDWLGDQDVIEFMCREAPKAVYELEHFGMPFDRNPDGTIYQRPFGGHTANYGEKPVQRSCAAADRTGHAMLHTLYQRNVRAKTNFFVEWLALDLIRDDVGDVVGVTALEMETGQVYILEAKVVLMATGGAGRIWDASTNAFINTGDGMGLAARAGIPLEDMEFWQFHPTGVAGAGVLLTEGCRGEGGILRNKDGERFMERYAPTLKDLAPRDFVSRSMDQEIKEGRGCGPNGDYVVLDLTHWTVSLTATPLRFPLWTSKPDTVARLMVFSAPGPAATTIPCVGSSSWLGGAASPPCLTGGRLGRTRMRSAKGLNLLILFLLCLLKNSGVCPVDKFAHPVQPLHRVPNFIRHHRHLGKLVISHHRQRFQFRLLVEPPERDALLPVRDSRERNRPLPQPFLDSLGAGLVDVDHQASVRCRHKQSGRHVLRLSVEFSASRHGFLLLFCHRQLYPRNSQCTVPVWPSRCLAITISASFSVALSRL